MNQRLKSYYWNEKLGRSFSFGMTIFPSPGTRSRRDYLPRNNVKTVFVCFPTTQFYRFETDVSNWRMPKPTRTADLLSYSAAEAGGRLIRISSTATSVMAILEGATSVIRRKLINALTNFRIQDRSRSSDALRSRDRIPARGVTKIPLKSLLDIRYRKSCWIKACGYLLQMLCTCMSCVFFPMKCHVPPFSKKNCLETGRATRKLILASGSLKCLIY